MSAPRFSALREFVRARDLAGARCDACALPIGVTHEHLFDPRGRAVRCACPSCARVLGDAAWKRVPRVVRRADPRLAGDAVWSALGVPIDLAFFRATHREGGDAADPPRIVATFPGAAGPIDAPLADGAWDAIAPPPLARDVEALLVNRTGHARAALVVSIDVAFALAGILRAEWRGPSGGPGVAGAIDRFFTDLGAEADRSAPCRS
jgi:hypothetical protein